MGSARRARICVMGSGWERNAMKVRGVWQVGQIRWKTSWIRAGRAAHLDGRDGMVSSFLGCGRLGHWRRGHGRCWEGKSRTGDLKRPGRSPPEPWP